MATVKTVVAAELKVEGLDKAGQSVGNFRKALKDAQQEVITMADKFGLASKEAAEAAKKVAALRDRIGDARQLSETFNPDKKFVALGGAIQGVTAGFSAFTGAMGLLGDQSKETEALLLKVQSAMAFQQGLSGLKASVDSFKLLGNAIKASTVFQKLNNAATVAATVIQRAFGASVVGTGTAFNVLKGAIIATGIGALVVLLGTAISKMNLFGDATEDAADAQEKLNAELERQKKNLDEIIQSNQLYVDRTIEIIKNNEKIADLQAKAGNNDRAIADLRKRNINLELQNVQVELQSKKGLLTTQEELNLKTKEYQLTKQAERVDIELSRKEQDKANAANEKAKDLAEKQKEQLEKLAQLRREGREKEKQAIEEYGQQLADLENEQAEAERQRLIDNKALELETKLALAEQALIDDPDSIDNKIAKTNADFELEMANFEGNEIQRQNLIKLHGQEITQIKQDEFNTLRNLQQQHLDNELTTYGAAASALSELIGRQTVAGKALAIAEATINVFKAGLQVFSQPMPGIPPVSLGIKIASMVAAIATGIVTVKKIVSTKVPGKGGGGGGAPSIPPIPAPIIPRPQTTALDQQTINQVGNAANRAYVLETDVSGNQERIRRLNRAARIN